MDRPILFSAPMVRALLAGTKTQTRRAVKLNAAGRVEKGGRQWHVEDGSAVIACPYGAAGDRLWVRETWAWPGEEEVIYRADPEAVEMVEGWKLDPNYPQIKWRPSIYMLRAHSRITLTITDVRCERLQDISSDDAAAEGWPGPDEAGTIRSSYPIAWYSHLWDQINGKGSWGVNPWVWAISFQPATTAGDVVT